MNASHAVNVNAKEGGSSQAKGIDVHTSGKYEVSWQTGGSVVKLTPVGIDIAKSVFQVHYVDQETGEIVNRPIKRAKFLEYFANRAPCLIGMKACGGSHHWARQLTNMGHVVKLMLAKFVKAFNIRNKNDAADARAIWLAVQ